MSESLEREENGAKIQNRIDTWQERETTFVKLNGFLESTPFGPAGELKVEHGFDRYDFQSDESRVLGKRESR